MNRVHFQKWAKAYEQDIILFKDKYPFHGYFKIIEIIGDELEPQNNVLDLGVGTGFMLSELLKQKSFNYYGLDFSDNMIQYAAKRLLKNNLQVWDIKQESIPVNISRKEYNVILSSFTLHHFTDEVKIRIILHYLSLMDKNGTFIIADISFDSLEDMLLIKEKYKETWDESEEQGYFIKEKFLNKMTQSFLKVEFVKVSECTAVYKITKN